MEKLGLRTLVSPLLKWPRQRGRGSPPGQRQIASRELVRTVAVGTQPIRPSVRACGPSVVVQRRPKNTPALLASAVENATVSWWEPSASSVIKALPVPLPLGIGQGEAPKLTLTS